MDSFTQIVLGASVAYLTLPKQMGKHRLWIGALFGTIPDLDVWIARVFYSDPLTEVMIHRGFSHSIVFFVLLSVFSAYFLRKIVIFHHISFKTLFYSLFVILFTHSLLDIFTTWGTQLFWPFADKLSLHSIFVIDPLYSLPLTFGLWMSIKKTNQTYNRIGLISSTAYLISTLLIQKYIEIKVNDKFTNQKVVSMVAKPTAMNTILWNVIVETDEKFYLTQVHIFDKSVEPFLSFDKNHEYLKEVSLPLKKQLKNITQGQYTVEKSSQGLVVNDMRFGLLKNEESDHQFAFSYLLNEENGIWNVKEQPKKNRDGKELLKKIAIRIMNPLK